MSEKSGQLRPSALPWIHEGDGGSLVFVSSETDRWESAYEPDRLKGVTVPAFVANCGDNVANATLICKAVNNHDKLVALVKRALRANTLDCDPRGPTWAAWMDETRALLAEIEKAS